MSDIENTGSQINKHIGEGVFDPLAYAGGESIAFPNGLIIKMGYIVKGGGQTHTVTFNTAFPNNIISMSVQGYDTSPSGGNEILVSAKSAAAFNFHDVNYTDKIGYYWLAIGY